jgi:DNA-binding response OmpR family regulator
MRMTSPEGSDEAIGLLLSDDLMFTSRVTGTARELGFKFLAARSPVTLESLARDHSPRCIILDLGNARLVIGDVLKRLRVADSVLPRIIAYGSHVDAAALRAAREAGCDVVLPRSKFVEELPRALSAWMAPHC